MHACIYKRMISILPSPESMISSDFPTKTDREQECLCVISRPPSSIGDSASYGAAHEPQNHPHRAGIAHFHAVRASPSAIDVKNRSLPHGRLRFSFGLQGMDSILQCSIARLSDKRGNLGGRQLFHALHADRLAGQRHICPA